MSVISNEDTKELLVLEDYDDDAIPSKWDHFQRIFYVVIKNINWFAAITTFVVTVALSVVSSNVIHGYIHESLQVPMHLQVDSMRRDLLMNAGRSKLNIDGIEDIERLEGIRSNRNSKSELERQLKEEDQIIDVFKEDIKAQQGIEEKLLKKIKMMEREHLKILKEQKQRERRYIWIGIAISTIMCVGAAFIFYAITVRKRNIFAEDDKNYNVAIQNKAKPINRSPTKVSQVTAAN